MSRPEGNVPVAGCAPCGRDVLTHVVADARGALERRCAHCDAPIDPDAVRWVDESALDALGYAIAPAGGGCGSGGCGTGGGCAR